MKHRTLKIAAALLLTSSCLILPVAAADMGNNVDARAAQNFFSPAPRDGQSMPGGPGGMGDSGLMGTPDENGAGLSGGQGDAGNSGGMGESGGMNGSGNSGSSGDMFDTTDGNLGDTSGPMESGDGVIEGTEDTNLSPMSDMADDTAGDTAGQTDEGGSSLLGIIITLLLIGAVVILIFALIPKRKS